MEREARVFKHERPEFESAAEEPLEILRVGARDESVYTTPAGRRGSLEEYLTSGQVLIGCEGNEEILAYLSQKIGLDAFAYASDYPHEVDVVAAEQMIQETLDRPDITWEEKAGVLGENARRFFKL
jgi:predicted TIM-barrel fold metal-dependent hydrolase